MTDFLDEQDDAATPLTGEEREALIPSYIGSVKYLSHF